jgi:aryl-alcohol dehydrogenase-like predicted oxidoreductase
MEIRNLGQSGLRVSSIGLGCNNFGGRIDEATTKVVIHKALDLGITLFDTADVYGERGGSEAEMGRILGDDRKRIVLATKFAAPMDDTDEKLGGSRQYIMAAVEDSLRRLKTDWIDLYQMHRTDPRTPIEETLRALDDLIRQGKVRYIGCSNFPAWQMTEAAWTARTAGLNGFVSCQDEFSLIRSEARFWAAALFSAGQRASYRQIPPQHGSARRYAPRQDPAAGRPLPDRTQLGNRGKARRLR